MNSKHRIQADELILGNEQGQHLTLSNDGFRLYESHTDMRAWLTLREGGVRLSLFDKNGHERIHLGIYGNGTPCVSVNDGNENERLVLMVEHDGCPYLMLNDGNHTRRIELTLGVDEGDPDLSMYSRSDKPIFTMGTCHSDEMTLRVPGEHGFVPWQPKKAA